jgi:spectinomycin phosphotransferase
LDHYGQIEAALREYYGISTVRIEPREGGWSAYAFLVETAGEKFFLKLYDKNRASAAPWIQAIGRYVPLLKWLSGNTELRGSIVEPVLTKTGQCKCEDAGYVYLLSEYIEGETIGEKAFAPGQVDALARILGTLHAGTPAVPEELLRMQAAEDFNTGYCDSLDAFLQNGLGDKEDVLRGAMAPYAACLAETTRGMRALADCLTRKTRRLVLCHADAHNWNIMQGKHLVLIDWECLKLAPQEQDMILNVTEPYAKRFLHEYARHTEYNNPDKDALEYYYLKRRLEDIWEWVKGLRVEGLVKPESHTLQLLEASMRDCTDIAAFRMRMDGLFGGCNRRGTIG